MFIDLLNSQNYIMLNMDAIRIFGLNAAVYCAELLNIYKKAKIKDKLIEKEYFTVNRKYITERTSLSLDDQLKCDINLTKVGIISKYNNEPDKLKFDVEKFASMIASEDVKLVNKVSDIVNVKSPKQAKQAKRDAITNALVSNIVCSNFELYTALKDWVYTIMDNPDKFLSKAQVKLFKETLDKYSGGDLDKALDVVKTAIAHAYVDCQWAINTYENEKKYAINNQMKGVRVTEQKKADKTSVNMKEVF